MANFINLYSIYTIYRNIRDFFIIFATFSRKTTENLIWFNANNISRYKNYINLLSNAFQSTQSQLHQYQENYRSLKTVTGPLPFHRALHT